VDKFRVKARRTRTVVDVAAATLEVIGTNTSITPGMPKIRVVLVRERDTRGAAELASRLPAAEDALDTDAPEVAAMLDEFIREYETRWLDEPIPALNGHTARQAADDPTRRGDLIKLLDSFPADADKAGRMSAERLRTLLGLQRE
jgi:hypothetical protein